MVHNRFRNAAQKIMKRNEKFHKHSSEFRVTKISKSVARARTVTFALRRTRMWADVQRDGRPVEYI